MRLWMVDPKFLCRSHLLGEHVECHMFAGSLKRNLTGYIDKGLVELHNLKARHDTLAEEMIKRGIKHDSPLNIPNQPVIGLVCRKRSLTELKVRCKECRRRIEYED